MKTLYDLEREYGNFYVPAFSIEIDGKDIKSIGAEVSGVTVDNVLEDADTFSFSVNNPYNAAKNEFLWLDNDIFKAGKEVSIKMGYGKNMELMILGMITSIRASFPAGGASQFEISGYDLCHRMMKGEKSRSWDNKKDSDVVSEIAGDYGFSTAGIKESGITHPKITMDKKSDYTFIKEKLAKRNKFEFYVRNKTLNFKPRKDPQEQVVKLQWGKTLTSFSPEINIAEMFTTVKVIGWDPSSKKEIIAIASRGEEEGKGKGESSGSEIAGKAYKQEIIKEIRKPVRSQAEADRLAKSLLNEISENLIKGNGECIGIPILRPGDTIFLYGIGNAFSKSYFLEKTTHTIGTSGYKTTFSVKSNSI